MDEDNGEDLTYRTNKNKPSTISVLLMFVLSVMVNYANNNCSSRNVHAIKFDLYKSYCMQFNFENLYFLRRQVEPTGTECTKLQTNRQTPFGTHPVNSRSPIR